MAARLLQLPYCTCRHNAECFSHFFVFIIQLGIQPLFFEFSNNLAMKQKKIKVANNNNCLVQLTKKKKSCYLSEPHIKLILDILSLLLHCFNNWSIATCFPPIKPVNLQRFKNSVKDKSITYLKKQSRKCKT